MRAITLLLVFLLGVSAIAQTVITRSRVGATFAGDVVVRGAGIVLDRSVFRGRVTIEDAPGLTISRSSFQAEVTARRSPGLRVESSRFDFRERTAADMGPRIWGHVDIKGGPVSFVGNTLLGGRDTSTLLAISNAEGTDPRTLREDFEGTSWWPGLRDKNWVPPQDGRTWWVTPHYTDPTKDVWFAIDEAAFARGVVVTGNHFEGSGASGFFGFYLDGAIVSHNVAIDCSDYGVGLEWATNSIISDNFVRTTPRARGWWPTKDFAAQSGIALMYLAARCLVVDNVVEDGAIRFAANGNPMIDVRVAGNIVRRGDIYVYSWARGARLPVWTERFTIEGNTVEDGGISLLNNWTDQAWTAIRGRVANNTVIRGRGPFFTGIRVQGFVGTVEGNTIEGALRPLWNANQLLPSTITGSDAGRFANARPVTAPAPTSN